MPIHPGSASFLVAIVQNPREFLYVLRCVIPIADTLLSFHPSSSLTITPSIVTWSLFGLDAESSP